MYIHWNNYIGSFFVCWFIVFRLSLRGEAMDNDLMVIVYFFISCFITIYRKQGIFYCRDIV